MRQETDGVLLESYLIYEQEHQVWHHTHPHPATKDSNNIIILTINNANLHQATWFKDDVALLGALDFDEKYQPFLERRGDWTYCALAIRSLPSLEYLDMTTLPSVLVPEIIGY